MKNSRRIERMKRNKRALAKLNLTPLMDVFTVLVFFLMINSASVETLQQPKQIKLPESVIEEKPRETVVIFVGKEEVLVQGYRLMQERADKIDDPSLRRSYLEHVAAHHEIAAANEAFPERPVEVHKAWKEMVHRYAAGLLGLSILAMTVLAWRGPARHALLARFSRPSE